MARTACLSLLGIIFAIVTALEVRLVVTTIEFAAHPEAIHYRLPMTDSLKVNVDQFGGLRRGDRIVAVDGTPVASRGRRIEPSPGARWVRRCR